MDYFGQSENAAHIMTEIIKLKDNEKSLFLYGSQEQRLTLVTALAKSLNIELTDEETASLRAGWISSAYIYDLFDFIPSGKQTYGIEYLFDTIGQDLETVVKEYEVNPHRIWTITLEGNDECITNGFYRVNRFAYLIQKQATKPCTLTFHDVWAEDSED